MTSALEDIAAERTRQVEVEGWSSQHDDGHVEGEMAKAASCYARRAGCLASFGPNETTDDGRDLPFPQGFWPWDRDWWKPKSVRRDLVRAAALIVAEIERLDRLPKDAGHGQ